MQRKSARLYWGLLVTAIFLFVVFSASEGLAAKKKKYDSWKGVAADMALEFDSAREDIEADRYRDAYKHVNDAYFGYYEVQGFEKNVMVAISSARVSHIEALFASIKHALLGNQEIAKDALLDMLESLRVKVYKDAMVLDGDIDAGEPDSLGEAVYGDKGRPAAGGRRRRSAPGPRYEPGRPVPEGVPLMFATLLREEVRTQARRNAGAVGIVAVIAVGFTLLSLLDLPAVSSLLLAGALAALGAMPAVVSVQVGIEYWASMYGARGYLTMSLPVRGRVIFAAKTLYAVIAGLVSAAVAALLGVGWLATYVHLRSTTLEELLQAVRQMISMVGAGILVFYGLAVVGGAVVTIIEVAAVMSIGAQGRWNRLGFGAPAVGFVILYAVNQIVSLVAALLLPLSLDLTSGRIVTRMMLPQFIEAVRLDQEPQLVGIGSVVVAPILAAILAWWAVRAIERHTCLR